MLHSSCSMPDQDGCRLVMSMLVARAGCTAGQGNNPTEVDMGVYATSNRTHCRKGEGRRWHTVNKWLACVHALFSYFSVDASYS